MISALYISFSCLKNWMASPAMPDFPRHRQFIPGYASHLGGNAIQVFHREARRIGKIVIETILDHRADGALGFRIKALHGHRHQVGGGMTNNFQAFRVPSGNYTQLRITLDQVARVTQHTVNLAGQRCLGQTRADIGSNVHHRDRLVESSLASVR